MRVLGLSPSEALLNAATQYELGFDVRGPFEKRKRRKKVAMQTAHDRREEGAEPFPFDLDPPA